VFERLTHHARQAILDAVQTAASLGADKAGPPHLLVALAHARDSLGARVLASYGLTSEALDGCLADRRRGLLGGPFDQDGKKVIELSLREAVALGQGRDIGTEHLLLALLRQGLPEPMRSLLAAHAVTYDDARQRILSERKAA